MSRETLEKLAQAVLDGVSEEEAVALAKAALEQGLDPLECVTDGLTKGIQEVGRLFASGEYFLPQLIVGADAMMAAMKIFEPELVGDQRREVAGTVVIGTVEGDLHEIGKGLVSTMLRGNGFRVIDVGVDKTAAEFVAAVEENEANIVGASALLTTTMVQQKKLIDTLTEAGLRDKVKVMVGGAPITEDYAEQIGADGYAADATAAVDLAMRFADTQV